MDKYIWVAAYSSYPTLTRYKVEKETSGLYKVSSPARVMPNISYDFYRQVMKGDGVCDTQEDAVDWLVKFIESHISKLEQEVLRNKKLIAAAKEFADEQPNA